MTIFGVPWADLTLEHVEEFLARAGPEPLHWEAKATELSAGEIRRQICGFANSHDGGYLILGADRVDESWRLPGVEFPNEPATWIADLVGDGGVRPYPDGFDTLSWPTAEGREAAVVRIEPTPTPPCNTYGAVYERVSGKTVPVREPLRLAALFARGDQAHAAARAIADKAAVDSMGLGWSQLGFNPEHIQIGVGYAAAGYLPDIGSRLFSHRFELQARSVISTVLGPDSMGGPPAQQIEAGVTQDALSFDVPATHRLGSWWSIRMTWDGGIGIYWRQAVTQPPILALVDGPLTRLMTAAIELAAALGAQGARYVGLAIAGGMFPPNPAVQPQWGEERRLTRLARGPLTSEIDRTVLAGVGRELNRTLGVMDYEPGE